jgi:hypothetical protein
MSCGAASTKLSPARKFGAPRAIVGDSRARFLFGAAVFDRLKSLKGRAQAAT